FAEPRDLMRTDAIDELRRRLIERALERAGERHLGVRAAVEVARAPLLAAAAEHQRRVGHGARRRVSAGGERAGVDDRLDRRSGLAPRLPGAIEIAGVRIASADDGADRRGFRIE